MTKKPFDSSELEILGNHIGVTENPERPSYAPIFNTPITPKENLKRAFRRDGTAMWIPLMNEMLYVESRTNTDHIARAEIRDLGPLQPLEEKGGPDLFGIEWVFVPQVGGSMVKPGNPLMNDVNDWEKLVKFPDVDALDWEGAKINAPLNASTRLLGVTFQNGFFERLISFMDFENAAMAMIDEDQQDAVHALFDKLADMYIQMIEKYREILDIDIVCMHDDWGSQRSPFFSLSTVNEMIVPHIKKVTDYCHKNGILINHHSCGKNQDLVPSMIAQGDDMWSPQPMNDFELLYDKYGDKLVISIAPEKLAQDASQDEIDAAAMRFAEKYGPDFASKPVIINTRECSPAYIQALYKAGRIVLSR